MTNKHADLGVRLVQTWLVLLLPAAGCAGESVNLGTDNAPTVTGAPGLGGAPIVTDAAGLEGTWVGSLVSQAFVASPKSLRLEIANNGQGSLLVGEAPLSPPTDPKVGFPPEAYADAAEASGMLLHLYDGITYALQNVRVNGRTLHFELDTIRAFQPWCALQTPVSWGSGVYRCRENLGGGVDRLGEQKRCYVTDPTTGAPGEEEDCLALFLCSVSTVGCHCTESECFASDEGQKVIAAFDLELNQTGTTLQGSHTFTDGSFSTDAVQFTRQLD